MDKVVKEQILQIRASGETNMLDIDRVQWIADREGFYELVIFIEEHRDKYLEFIMYGKQNSPETTEPETQQPEENAINRKYDYCVSGSARKELVKSISTILNLPAIYQQAPTFSFQIGGCNVGRYGTLTFSTDVPPEEIGQLVAALKTKGYIPRQNKGIPEEEEEETVGITENTEIMQPIEDSATFLPETSGMALPEDNGKSDTLTVELPKDHLTEIALINLQKIVDSKALLLKLALKTDSLEIEVTEDKIRFPWFTLSGVEGELDAYTHLITAMAKMAKKQKRVLATEKPIENAKYSMRLFLVRLGFIGDEYKVARKILLKDLTGNCSWKAGHRPEKPADNPPILPPDPETASDWVPETKETSINTELKGLPEHNYTDNYADTFPEDKEDAPYDKK